MKKISKIFLSSLQFMKTKKKFQSPKCKMPGGEIQNILKIFKVQTGSNNSRWLLLKKNFKVEIRIWLNKIQKIKIKSKFRLTDIFKVFLKI